MSLLVISGILRHFVNTLNADDKHSLPNSEKIPPPIQMQLSKKPIIFSEFFSPFLNSICNFHHFEKKDALIAYISPEIHAVKDLL